MTPIGRGRSTTAIILAAGLVGSAATATEPSPTEGPTDAVAPSAGVVVEAAPDGWALAWSDEFAGPAGTAPDPAVWGYDLGDGSAIGLPGWGNLERQRYTDDADNVAMDGAGHLLLTVRADDGSVDCYYGPCEYTSARLLTRNRLEVRYGRVEARIRVPVGVGLWPAFWMLGAELDRVGWPDAGEIDVMEHVGRRPNEVLGTLHGPGYSGSSGPSGTVDLGAPVAGAIHVFAVEWRPGRIRWLLDDVPYHEVSSADVDPHPWVFDQPSFLVLNIAVGGTLGGPVSPDTTFPASMEVDHIRVYEEVTP